MAIRREHQLSWLTNLREGQPFIPRLAANFITISIPESGQQHLDRSGSVISLASGLDYSTREPRST